MATAVVSSSPVLAKGVESASIDGVGLDHPIEIASAQGWTLGQLADLTAMWAVTPGYPEPVALLDRPPAEHLGRSFTLTWRVLTGPDETTELVQRLYPNADPDPLVYTAAGQQIYDGSTAGGWYRASVTLRELLVSVGVPPLDGSTGIADAQHCATAGRRRRGTLRTTATTVHERPAYPVSTSGT